MRYLKLFPAIFLFLFPPMAGAAPFAPLHEAAFDNGVRLVVEEDHSAPVAIVQIWLKVGGRDETSGKTGLAHVFEHMMFKGSKKLAAGEFSRRIAAMGGNDNAFTSHDYTAYFEIVPAAKVDEVLGMEAERFGHLNLRAEDFAKEIQVIQEERRMRTDDDPNSRMFEELTSVALRLHPYREPVIGWMQDLKKLDIDDVRAFYKAHYIPGNVTVVVVGDVDFADIKKTVARTFGKLKKQPVEARFNPVEPEPIGPKRMVAVLPAQLPMLAVTMPVPVWKPGENDREAAALAVATEILAGGRSALLNREIVDKQRKAFAAAAGYDPFSMGIDMWFAYGMLGPKQTPEAFEAALWATIGTLRDKGPDATQLAAAKRRMVADQVFAQDSLYIRAKEIGMLETVGIGAGKRDAWLAALGSVRAEDVKGVLKQWIRQERSTTGLLQPEVKS
ncbi:MAG: peptidase M16 [Zetaproteobacteria bacterium CG1_02_55_237]|nr:MAG: peptidase M16 [Zetaproteobacteria bacterium CG1_02_55_237]